MKHIDVQELNKIIDAQPVEMPLMIIGDTGIGKTQVIKNYAKENKIYLKALILSQIEASEALGIPVQSKRVYNGVEYNTIETAVPTWVFDLAENDPAILYLDELLCAEPAVMNSFLNFITEREIAGINLSHVKIIASTNIGNYTYDPDNNILSRFSMVYAENKNYNSYLKKKYGSKVIANDYKDEEELEGAIFERRSLKPRCQELLCLVKNDEMREIFYEGFTNMQMCPVFHSLDKINNIVKGFATKNEDYNRWEICNDDIETLAGLIYKATCNSRKKNIVEYATTFKNVRYDANALKYRFKEIWDSMSASNY